jgi:hypothetical protein
MSQPIPFPRQAQQSIGEVSSMEVYGRKGSLMLIYQSIEKEYVEENIIRKYVDCQTACPHD